MKQKPVLLLAIILSIIVEIAIMISVYLKVGDEILSYQIGRLIFQLILIVFILGKGSNTALFILAGYHIVSGLYILYSSISDEILGKVLIFYHLIIGLAIYLHDWIENKLGIENNNQ